MINWVVSHMLTDLSKPKEKEVQAFIRFFNCIDISQDSSLVYLITVLTAILSTILSIFLSSRYLANIWGQGITVSTSFHDFGKY